MATKKTRAVTSKLTGVLMTGSESDGDGGEVIHIPGGSLCGFMTLCGYCDVPGKETIEIRSAAQITCSGCLDMLETALPYAGAIRRKKR